MEETGLLGLLEKSGVTLKTIEKLGKPTTTLESHTVIAKKNLGLLSTAENLGILSFISNVVSLSFRKIIQNI